MIKQALAFAPAFTFRFPDPRKDFKLYIHERQGLAFGVLILMLREVPYPVAYLCRQLDAVAKGWPPCLCAVAITCDLLQETEKNHVRTAHGYICVLASVGIIRTKGGYWLTAGQMGKYQAILLDHPNVI